MCIKMLICFSFQLHLFTFFYIITSHLFVLIYMLMLIPIISYIKLRFSNFLLKKNCYLSDFKEYLKSVQAFL